MGGATGRRVQNITGSKIARITGMDPARPLFEDIELTGTGRLTKDDAELVVIIHSDAGLLGYLHEAGHIDFFPNGGTASQPGCVGEDITGASEYRPCAMLSLIDFTYIYMLNELLVYIDLTLNEPVSI